jgi:hypothetical protein
MLACGQGSLEAGDSRGLRTHAGRKLRLGQACFVACFEQGIQQFALFAFNAIDFGGYAWAAHQFFDQFIVCGHVSPLSFGSVQFPVHALVFAGSS